MQKLILLSLALLIGHFAQAQINWDGGGDGTSWEDPLNWAGDMVPATDSIAAFTVDATVTGTMTNVPVQIRIGANRNVVLDLDLTIGNGMTEEHAIILNDTSSLTLGTPDNNRTVTLNAPTNKHGVVMFGGTDGAQLTIAESTTVNADQGLTVVNLANGTSSVINNGSISVSDNFKDGFRISGSFTNNGDITGGAVETDLIQVKGGATFTNTAAGMIVSNTPGDDGIEITEEATFINAGTLILTVKDDAGSANSAIAVGNADTAGSFVNGEASVIANGGASENARPIYVYPMGELTNGGLLTLTGGNANSRLFVQGTATNGFNAILDLTDGRINVNEAAFFTNNGLVRSTRDGSGIFVTGTAVNNAFFDYSTSNQFAGGAMGDITDNGISLNNNDTRINAMNECTVDIAETPYEWFVAETSIATAADDGAFTFPENSVMADSVIMTTSIPGVEVKVINICDAAVDVDTRLFGPQPETINLSLFPNPLRSGETVSLDLRALTTEPITFAVINTHGQVVQTVVLNGGTVNTLNSDNWPAGMYLIRSIADDLQVVGRVIVE